MDPTIFLSFVEKVGLAGVLVFWLLWRADQKFIPAVEQIAEGTKANTEAIKALAEALTGAKTTAQGDAADIYAEVAVVKADVAQVREIVAAIPRCPLLEQEVAKMKGAA